MAFLARYPSVAGQPKHLSDFQFKQVLLESHRSIHFYLSLVACFHWTFFRAKSFLRKQQHTHKQYYESHHPTSLGITLFPNILTIRCVKMSLCVVEYIGCANCRKSFKCLQV